MAKLTPSLNGANYTQQQKKEMWIDIHWKFKCPECGASDSMLKGPRGGLAINVKCSKCKTVFWSTPLTAFGAYPVSREAPQPKERR